MAKQETINLVFDKPPGPDGCRFIEAERLDGTSLSVGKWVDLPNGLVALQVTVVHPAKG